MQSTTSKINLALYIGMKQFSTIACIRNNYTGLFLKFVESIIKYIFFVNYKNKHCCEHGHEHNDGGLLF